MNLPESDSPEEALRQTQADYHMLVDSLPVCLLRKDRQGRAVFANKPYLEFHGISLETLIANGEPPVTDERNRARFQKEDQATLIKGTVFQGVVDQVCSDGSKCWVERLKGPHRDADGKIVGVQVLFWVVTEQVEAEMAHQREAALLQTLLKSIPDAIYFKDAESRYIRISESMAAMFGLSSAAEAVGKSDAEFFTSEHAEQAREDELRVMESGQSIVGRVERETWPDRPDTWVSSTKLPLKDAAGNIIGTFGLSRDITDVITVEEELAHERDRLQTLMNHLPDVIFIKDRVGRFLMTNPALNRLYGCKTSDELVGKTDFDFVPEDVARNFAEDDKAVMESGKPLVDREESNVDQRGEELWMLTSKIPLRDVNSNVVGLVGIGRDITKLKRAEQEATRKAMEAELLYEATRLVRETDSMEDALRGCLSIVCNLTGWDVGHVLRPSIDDASPYLESMGIWFPEDDTGYLTLRNATLQSRIPPSKTKGLSGVAWATQEPRWVESLRDELRNEKGQFFHDNGFCSGVAFPIIIHDEAVAVLEFFANDVQPENSRLLSVFQSVGEQVGRVMERKRAEEALRHALDAADAANRAKSDFLANVSHEIRTPMNGVIGMTELLMETSLTAMQREYLTLVQASGESLLDLINDILDFSKIESGKMELESIPFELRESLGDTMKLLGTRAHKQKLELAFSVAEDVPDFLLGDPARLRQIVVNLVGNAIKFTLEGEVVLRVNTTSKSDDEVQLEISVSDTGIGIPPDKIDHVFESFQQADTSTTRSFGGTGLGLAISTRLVELMSGKISCESVVGQGSVFRVEVPFGIAHGYQSSSRDPVVVHGTRVLVVDDNETNRRILVEMCTNWGMIAAAVGSADDAMSLLDSARADEPYVLLLSDVHMPLTDGFGLCEMIRADGRYADLKIIMLTSGGRPEDAVRRQQLNIAGHLLKPVKQSELFDSIVTLLEVNATEATPDVRDHDLDSAAVNGLNVLLAEDNVVNQKLAMGLLKNQGHFVTLARNGAEAVRLYSEAAFDVVLMDVQMPELDGLQATAAIRDYEQQHEVRTPIVAMTAHAMKGDRELCLAAGMDEYLSKPIRGKQIAEMFARLKLQPAGKEQPTDAGPLRLSAGEPVSLVDWDQALESVDKDRELLKAVIDAFLEEAPQLLEQARIAIESQDAGTLHRMGHTLKGALLSLGAGQTATLAATLERIGATGTTDGTLEVHSQLSQQLLQVSEEFSAFSLG